ncbi:MAG: hypothetical protein HYS17_06605 [Micavibrio aeruginosavorus]|uniref:Lipoprotein n=1 Tax=Micavibrio aeruginosavorus TaxID=349221 RepID=A0A7T5R0G3_9BACT|nr:MAG: hypothetical protein HYS17_06605 [Micavibrio aeruginosavorus]
MISKLKSIFAGYLAALSVSACTSLPSAPQETEAPKLPDFTQTHPKTGCRYLADETKPETAQSCIIRDFPAQKQPFPKQPQ